jgi:2Fe-2S ferredoxin
VPEKKHITIEFVNQFNSRYIIKVAYQNQLDNLMEIIRDYGYEDWGECRGRAWCKTCHVSLSSMQGHAIGSQEKQALEDVLNKKNDSRLACQIPIKKELDGAVITYLGDN